MTDDQITALARVYAEFTDMSPVDKKNISTICECFLKYTLRRYCLVEKSKLRKQYAKWMLQFCSTRDVAAKEYAAGRLNALEFLFPEIEKEVEG